MVYVLIHKFLHSFLFILFCWCCCRCWNWARIERKKNRNFLCRLFHSLPFHIDVAVVGFAGGRCSMFGDGNACFLSLSLKSLNVWIFFYFILFFFSFTHTLILPLFRFFFVCAPLRYGVLPVVYFIFGCMFAIVSLIYEILSPLALYDVFIHNMRINEHCWVVSVGIKLLCFIWVYFCECCVLTQHTVYLCTQSHTLNI